MDDSKLNVIGSIFRYQDQFSLQKTMLKITLHQNWRRIFDIFGMLFFKEIRRSWIDWVRRIDVSQNFFSEQFRRKSISERPSVLNIQHLGREMIWAWYVFPFSITFGRRQSFMKDKIIRLQKENVIIFRSKSHWRSQVVLWSLHGKRNILRDYLASTINCFT